jgi:uncharacterized RDD family membrane protein YckC/ribosomal protein L40E
MFCSKCGAKNEDEASFCSGCGGQLTTAATKALRPDQVQSFKSEQTSRYAGFWYRTLAWIIDTIITMVAGIIIVLPLAFALGASMAGTSSATEISSAGEALGNLVGILITWLYFTISESSPWQATLGKKLLGLKVADEAGNRIGFGKANGRYWSKILSALILCIGFIMVAFTENKQGLHDKIAGTFVFKD